ncbi:MAG: ClbS/DfsB family four-helix bundle protein [Microcella sp.]|nr:ClbS/DfsB family four-helix bundle protein [Microcella sp.]
MSRFTTKQALLDDILRERSKLEKLLASIPDYAKLDPVIDGLSVKDLLAHRTEWGRMMLSWYREAVGGGTPSVPSARHKWNQLATLNAEIVERFADTSLGEIEREFVRVHDELFATVTSMTDDELFEARHYPFTGTSDLAAYVNSATAAHYRSARTHIARWWKAR